MRFVSMMAVVLFAWNHPVSAQIPIDTLEVWLEKRSEMVMMSAEAVDRERHCDTLVEELVQLLEVEGSFTHPFNHLRRISMIQAPDTSFRVFTGQLYHDENRYSYYGVLQLRDNPGAPIVFADQSDAIRDLEGEIGDKKNWYGAVYYSMKSFSKEGKKYYVLFGFDSYQLYENRKVAEVLHFSEGQPVFGAPVFINDHEQISQRLVVQYASDVTVKLNYDEDLKLIVFDHLIPIKSPYKGKKIAMVPDGSYQGYQLTPEGIWMYIEKIFHTTLAAPPREAPVLDAESGKDILGKKKKNRR